MGKTNMASLIQIITIFEFFKPSKETAYLLTEEPPLRVLVYEG